MDPSGLRLGVRAPKNVDSGYAVALVAALPWQGEPPASPSDIERYPLQVEDGIHAEIQIAAVTSRERKQALQQISRVIPAKEAQALLENEGRVLTWLKKEENRARYVTDPLGSLRAMGVKLEEETWRKLSAARAARLRIFDASALNQVRSLKVGLRPEGASDERG